jgi:hypothetical protein
MSSFLTYEIGIGAVPFHIFLPPMTARQLKKKREKSPRSHYARKEISVMDGEWAEYRQRRIRENVHKIDVFMSCCKWLVGGGGGFGVRCPTCLWYVLYGFAALVVLEGARLVDHLFAYCRCLFFWGWWLPNVVVGWG